MQNMLITPLSLKSLYNTLRGFIVGEKRASTSTTLEKDRKNIKKRTLSKLLIKMSVNRTQAEEEKPSMNNDTQFLNLRVKGQDDAEMFFRVKQTTKLHKLIDAFCKHRSLDSKTVAFLFDGRRIKEHQTPQELGMEDGDEIDAMLHQTGGSHIAYI